MTISDIIRDSSFRLDATLPYIPDEGPTPDLNEVLSQTLFICNCPAYAKSHRH